MRFRKSNLLKAIPPQVDTSTCTIIPLGVFYPLGVEIRGWERVWIIRVFTVVRRLGVGLLFFLLSLCYGLGHPCLLRLSSSQGIACSCWLATRANPVAILLGAAWDPSCAQYRWLHIAWLNKSPYWSLFGYSQVDESGKRAATVLHEPKGLYFALGEGSLLLALDAIAFFRVEIGTGTVTPPHPGWRTSNQISSPISYSSSLLLFSSFTPQPPPPPDSPGSDTSLFSFSAFPQAFKEELIPIH